MHARIQGGARLSERGRHLLSDAPMPEYIHAHFARLGDPTYIGLSIAENKLVWDLIGPMLSRADDVPAWTASYGSMVGSLWFRERLADFLGTHLLGHRPDPGQIAALAGAGSVLECLFTAIGDEGDGVLVPTPSYAGFWADLGTRARVRPVPVHTFAEDGFRLRISQLEAALADATLPVRALLLTNPDNPTGRVLSPEELVPLVDWARGRGLQVVMNEVYGLSVFEGGFTSVRGCYPRLGDDLHVVWAVSKDLACSGLRCGVLVTENPAVVSAVNALAYWSAVSGETQWRLGRMLGDETWVQPFLDTSRDRLASAHASARDVLDRAGVPVVPSRGGLFLLCDLRRVLPEPTWEGELRLWNHLLHEANVNLTPGADCRVSEPGFFRVCFATEPAERVREGLTRVLRALGESDGLAEARSGPSRLGG